MHLAARTQGTAKSDGHQIRASRPFPLCHMTEIPWAESSRSRVDIPAASQKSRGSTTPSSWAVQSHVLCVLQKSGGVDCWPLLSEEMQGPPLPLDVQKPAVIQYSQRFVILAGLLLHHFFLSFCLFFAYYTRDKVKTFSQSQRAPELQTSLLSWGCSSSAQSHASCTTGPSHLSVACKSTFNKRNLKTCNWNAD